MFHSLLVSLILVLCVFEQTTCHESNDIEKTKPSSHGTNLSTTKLTTSPTTSLPNKVTTMSSIDANQTSEYNVSKVQSNSTIECHLNGSLIINGTTLDSMNGSRVCLNSTENSLNLSTVLNSTENFISRNYHRFREMFDNEVEHLRHDKHMEALLPFLFGVSLGLLCLILYYFLRLCCTPTCVYGLCYVACCCWCCRRRQNKRPIKKKDVLGMEENNYLLVSSHQDSDSEV